MPEPAKLPIKERDQFGRCWPRALEFFRVSCREIDHVFDNFGWRLWPPIGRPGQCFRPTFFERRLGT